MRKYTIVYWTNICEGLTSSFVANDVQWKEYGIRAVNDEAREHLVFPYNSVQYVRLEKDE